MDSLDATTMRPAKRARASDADVRGLTVLTLTIAWHPDASRVGESALFERSTKLSRLEPEFIGSRGPAPIADPNVSRRPLELVETESGEVEIRAPDGGSGVSIEGVPVTDARVLSAREVLRGVVIAIGERIVLVLRRASQKRGGGELAGLIGSSSEVGWMVEQIARVAASDVHVLVRGATGTGKELVAAAIHRQSERGEAPFIAVNMTTLPPATASSQLFGHQKGAFTGASSDRAGFFSAADGGTIFLDEIGETPIEVQAMLLRTLESGEVTPLGHASARTVDVRIIAATDANLELAVEQGRFRSPLLHRLAGYQIDLPSLAERREDIGPLLVHFLRSELAKVGSRALELRQPTEPMWLSATQLTRLIRHRWPGNVRQLRNLARRLAISCGDLEVATDEELRRGLATGQVRAPSAAGASDDRLADASPPAKRRRPDQISDEQLISALRESRWQTGAAATALGISRTSLYALIERSDAVRKARDIEADEITGALRIAGGDVAAAAASLEVSERGLKLRIKELDLSG